MTVVGEIVICRRNVFHKTPEQSCGVRFQRLPRRNVGFVLSSFQQPLCAFDVLSSHFTRHQSNPKRQALSRPSSTSATVSGPLPQGRQ